MIRTNIFTKARGSCPCFLILLHLSLRLLKVALGNYWEGAKNNFTEKLSDVSEIWITFFSAMRAAAVVLVLVAITVASAFTSAEAGVLGIGSLPHTRSYHLSSKFLSFLTPLLWFFFSLHAILHYRGKMLSSLYIHIHIYFLCFIFSRHAHTHFSC